MRREHNNVQKTKQLKTGLYISIAVFIISLVSMIGIVTSYNSKINNDRINFEEAQQIAKQSVNNTLKKDEISEVNEIKEASMQMGKTVEEGKEEQEKKQENTIVTSNTNENNTSVETNAPEVKNEIKQNVTEEKQQQIINDPKFEMPVDGEIIKEYAKENLVYSETLKEWVTHNGIDIKAPKATVVKAAEDGTITAIKNDPRYGITVTIEHTNGYTTRYSNLLTAEFVVVGEQVAKGQTIGTVGNTASFEVSDEPHLHFEILKDNENIDPGLYVNNKTVE